MKFTIKLNKSLTKRHSREGLPAGQAGGSPQATRRGENPGKHCIPGQTRNDRLTISCHHAEGILKNQTGSALIITLLIVTILVALTVEFAYEVYMDTTSLSNWNNAQKASLIARSGQTLSTKYIAEAKKRAYTDIGELTLPVARDLGPGVGLMIQFEDENAKFNVNSIIRQNGMTEETSLASLKKLFEYLNINMDLALVIADWIDPDSEPRLPGAEDSVKNAPLWSVDELKLIPGISKDVFGMISPYITIFGNNDININTAKLPVLISLHPDMTETLAKRIIDYRETSPFEAASHLQRVTGMESIGIQVLGKITVKSSSIRVTSRATVHEITRIIESVMDTSNRIFFWREA